jgi:hypothetical protein
MGVREKELGEGGIFCEKNLFVIEGASSFAFAFRQGEGKRRRGAGSGLGSQGLIINRLEGTKFFE